MKCKNCKAMCCCINKIRIGWEDIKKLSNHFEMTVEKFINKYTQFKLPKKYYDGWIIPWAEVKYKIISGCEYCIFINSRNFKCTVYDVKPEGCTQYVCGKFQEDTWE